MTPTERLEGRGTVSSMLQPHENVTGADRDDDLLSLEPSAMAHRDLIGSLACAVYDACMVGNPAPKVLEAWERITHPSVGDLVYVTDGRYRRNAPIETRVHSLGFLVERRREWWSTDEQWAAEMAEDDSLAPGERLVERDAIYVQYGPSAADVCRWVKLQHHPGRRFGWGVR